MDIKALFTNGVGQTHKWRIKEVDTAQSDTGIYQVLQRLTTTHLFDETGVEIFKTVLSAAFVETTETVIFGFSSESDPEEEQEKTIQSFEILLPQEAQQFSLVEKVDFLVDQNPVGTVLKDFRFEALEEQEEATEPQVILRAIDK